MNNHVPARPRIVLTGGPGAGKTAVLEVVRRHFGGVVHVLPESASILFKGGFPRGADPVYRRAVQRAIFHVQRELESLADGDPHGTLVLCDRGTLDGMAYWPDPPGAFWAGMHTTLEQELARYAAVIHLRTPPADHGYNHVNPIRTENPEEAAVIDARILEVWSTHPRRYLVESTHDFMAKVARVLEILHMEVRRLG